MISIIIQRQLSPREVANNNYSMQYSINCLLSLTRMFFLSLSPLILVDLIIASGCLLHNERYRQSGMNPGQHSEVPFETPCPPQVLQFPEMQ